MAHFDIGYDDFAYYAFYLKGNNSAISFERIAQYVKLVKADLDAFNVDYTIVNGESAVLDLSLQKSLTEKAKKIKLVKDQKNRLYSLNINDPDGLFMKVNSSIPLYIRSFLEPKGYEEILGLTKTNSQLER